MKEINGDFKLSSWQKICYLILSLISALQGFIKLQFKKWQPAKINSANVSLARDYLNQFLVQKIPELILKQEIWVLDIGCGNGELRKKLADLGYSGQYTGVDEKIDKDFFNYENSSFKTNLVLKKIEDYQTKNKFDLIFSITSLEHIADDKKTIEKLKDWLKPDTIQIHIIPSFWSFFLYGWHGYRQYTPKRIVNLFGRQNIQLYKLGGFFSFLFQLLFSTLPQLLKIKNNLLLSWIIKTKPKLIPTLDRIFSFCAPLYVVILKPQLSSFKE